MRSCPQSNQRQELPGSGSPGASPPDISGAGPDLRRRLTKAIMKRGFFRDNPHVPAPLPLMDAGPDGRLESMAIKKLLIQERLRYISPPCESCGGTDHAESVCPHLDRYFGCSICRERTHRTDSCLYRDAPWCLACGSWGHRKWHCPNLKEGHDSDCGGNHPWYQCPQELYVGAALLNRHQLQALRSFAPEYGLEPTNAEPEDGLEPDSGNERGGFLQRILQGIPPVSRSTSLPDVSASNPADNRRNHKRPVSDDDLFSDSDEDSDSVPWPSPEEESELEEAAASGSDSESASDADSAASAQETKSVEESASDSDSDSDSESDPASDARPTPARPASSSPARKAPREADPAWRRKLAEHDLKVRAWTELCARMRAGGIRVKDLPKKPVRPKRSEMQGGNGGVEKSTECMGELE